MAQLLPLDVIVVAYRADGHLRRCLAQLPGHSRVVVIDNDSSAATRDIVTAAGARYVDAGSNLGFAGAVNVGLQQVTGGDDVLLLNPDARIDASGIAVLQQSLHDPARRLAAVGPALVGPDGRRQAADWPMPSPLQVWADALMLGRHWSGRRFVTGAVLMLRGDALAELGGFDERYFLYAEEADWQQRAQLAGWQVAVVDEVTAVHVGGVSSEDDQVRLRHFHTSGRLFARRWYGPVGAAVMRLGSILAAVRRCVLGRGARRRSAWAALRFELGLPR